MLLPQLPKILQAEYNKWKLHTYQTNWNNICQVAFQLDTELLKVLFLAHYFSFYM
jgi:hypothetical protein